MPYRRKMPESQGRRGGRSRCALEGGISCWISYRIDRPSKLGTSWNFGYASSCRLEFRHTPQRSKHIGL